MANKPVLKRGFKANAERKALEIRKSLGLSPWSPLCAFKVAEHLKISVYDATEFVNSPSSINILTGNSGHDSEWSALTMWTKAENRIIIYNPFHSQARQQSDIMHELAHIICEHEGYENNENLSLPFGLRKYHAEQEEEANCLGSTLQLAKPCLFWAKKRNLPYEEIAKYFNASTDMVKFRMNITGISKHSYMNKKI